MIRPLATANRTQMALQSYLDGLLQDAAIELSQSPSPVMDEFVAAVLEEQVRDARQQSVVEPALVARQSAVLKPPLEVPAVTLVAPQSPAKTATVVNLKEPVVEPISPSKAAPVVSEPDKSAIPDWASGTFECLLFEVAGLTLAVPLVCLGSIYPLQGQELTPIFGQPEWFLGILPSQAGNLKVLDTARWVMPERYREGMRDGLQYVISVDGHEWGLAVHQVSRSIRLSPEQIKWRSQRTQRPWLAGTVIEHMCALVDVSSLAEMISSGAAKRIAASQAL